MLYSNTRAFRRAFIRVALLAAVVMAAFTVMPAQGAGQNGTTLSAEKTAEGLFERTVYYDWALSKTAANGTVTVARNASGAVGFVLQATKTATLSTDVYGVSGEICVTNGGEVATENLKVADRVQFKTGSGQFQDLPGATYTVNPPQLAAGQSGCYPYRIEFVPIPDATYRNTVKVTITNHSGHLGTEFGPEPKADFSLPGSPTIIPVDGEATVTDAVGCPAGFTCTTAGPFVFTDSGSVAYDIVANNVSAPCDEYFTMSNVAKLSESSSGQTRTASAAASLFSDRCASTCTRTIGYWKTHAGFHGNNADRITQHLPVTLGAAGGTKSLTVSTAAQARGLLEFSGDASNGINKLYAQLLAVKLNGAVGADLSSVASTVAAADAFLANNNTASWATLSKSQRTQVNNWMTTFDNYNNGLIGPGHCN